MTGARSVARDRQWIRMERTYDASPEDVWALWTTKDGIEAWWGPDGFSVTVRSIDLRPGGELRYAMTATRAQEVEFMKRAGMPLTQELLVRYVEVEPERLLRYRNRVDFVPGVDPYEVETRVELHVDGKGVRLLLLLESMHDDTWTQRQAQGWEMELGRLSRALTATGRAR